MPTYKFRNTITGEITESIMRIAVMEELLATHPELEHYHDTPLPSIDPVTAGRVKPPESFRDLLRTIKKTNRRSTVNAG